MTCFLRFTRVFLAGVLAGCILTGLSSTRLLAQTITSVAGNGKEGCTGDGGPAIQANLSAINVAVDRQGNFFVVDEIHQRIRKVASNGIITTVAGNGNFGYSGDGILATSTALKYPAAVTADAQGNLFIADRENQRIRKVAPNGIITTVAGNGTYGFSGDGGPATQAKMSSPRGIVIDAQGNLFFADRENSRVRKIATNGTISTIAGTGAYGFSGDGGPASSARLAYPTELALDAQGNLFIADEANFRIRKVAPNGIITTVVGSGQGGYSGDGGPATRASIGYPGGIALDAQGNLFIADPSNLRIRKVAPNGIITTVAGDGIEGFGGDGARASSARLSYPAGLAIDGQGNLLIADSGNNRIRKVMASSQSPAVVSVSLINADTEKEIKLLSEGETINLASLPTRNLNFRMNTSPATVGSVKMVLSGAYNQTRTETDAPFALFGDNQGNYNAWTPVSGSYNLTATPYTGPGGSGSVVTSYSLNFKVTNQPSAVPQVVSFSLINADTDQEIKQLINGDVLNLASFPTKNLNIRANTQPATVGSVKMVLSGPQSRTQIDNGIPYALLGDKNGDYNAWTPSVGSYSLTGTTYTGSGGTGVTGTPLTLTFQVINQTQLARIGAEASAEDLPVMTYPNPFRESFTLKLKGQADEKIPVVMVDAYGRKVLELLRVDPAGQVIVPSPQLAPGVYVLQVGEGHRTQRYKLVKDK
ncbi:NHL domain-containing protein [Larkinella arboricola]